MLRVRRRRGFTLVELLIVIIIMGILAGSMMLAMGKARAKAEATKIVSNLRTLQKAAMFYYADNNEWYPENFKDQQETSAFMTSKLLPYIDSDVDATGWVIDADQYFIWVNDNKEDEGYGNMYAVCWVSDEDVSYETRQALEEMCSSGPFYNGNIEVINGGPERFKAEPVVKRGYTNWNSQISILIYEE